MESRNKRLKYALPTAATCILLLLLFPFTALCQSILWKTENNGHTLYIMGSIHVLKATHYPLAQAMEKAYTDSDLIAFEVDIGESESIETQHLFMREGMYQNGQTLQSSLSTQTFTRLKRYLKTIQLSPNLFQRMKPPLCAMTITIIEMQRLGFDAKYGLDKYFSEKAKKDGKQTAALETLGFQVKLFFDMNRKEQELFLSQTLTEMALMQSIMTGMEQAWVRGDGPALHAILYESFTEFPEFYDRLLLQRNRNWLPKIKTIHKEQHTALIVVGAAHLVGEGSVIDLLEQQGYVFEQL